MTNPNEADRGYWVGRERVEELWAELGRTEPEPEPEDEIAAVTEIVDHRVEYDRPFTRWAVAVTYPTDHGGQFAGRTVRLRAEADRSLAEEWCAQHLRNGAAEAVVQRQVWTPSDWEVVDS